MTFDTQIKDHIKELELLISARYCIIFIETAEDERVGVLIKHLSDRLRLPYFSWTRTKGLKREDIDTRGPIYNSNDLSMALSHIESSNLIAIYHFFNLDDYLGDATIATRLKDAAKQFSKNNGAIVITGTNLNIPDVLKPMSARFRLPDPSLDEYRELLHHIIRDVRGRFDVRLEISDEDINRLLNNLKGLTLMEAEKILTKAMIEDSNLCAEDITKVIDAKREVVEKEGVLESLD